MPAPTAPKPTPSAAFDPKADHVFISHGKQRAIATQIKELLEFLAKNLKIPKNGVLQSV